MEHWGIAVAKEDFKFSAAHFLIFPDGTAERLHGHNYRVFVELRADLSEHGLVIDFQMIKPLVREIVGRLDEHWIVPGEHPVLTADQRSDGVWEVRYGDRYYAAPAEDVIVLPINNTSSENLAGWIGRELRGELERLFPEAALSWLRLAVEETPGQHGIYEHTRDPDRA